MKSYSLAPLYPLLARSLPYLFPLIVVRPGGTSEAATGYLVRFLTFVALVLGWSGCERLLLRFAQIPEEKSWRKIAALLVSAAFALSLFVIAQGIFSKLPNGFPIFLCVISASSLASVARRKEILWALPVLSGVWWVGVPYLGISLLFGGWAWPPLLYSIALGVLFVSLDLAQELETKKMPHERYGTVYGILLFLGPVLTGLMAMAGLQLPLVTAIYGILPVFARHLQGARTSNYTRGESLPLAREAGACALLFALSVLALHLVPSVL